MANAEPTAKAGWEVKTLGEVLSFEYGKPLPKEKRHESGAYPVFGANGIKARSNKYYHDKPSIVVGRKGSAGEVNLTGGPFWPLDVTFFVKFDDSRYNLKFLFNLLTSLNLPSFAKGVKPGINRNEVYALQSQFPPLAEQERIVGILDEAFEGIAAATAQAEKNLHNARELFQSVLQSTFFQKGDDWVTCPLADLLELITYGFTNPMPTTDTGPYMVTAKNIREGRINYETTRHTSKEAFDELLTKKSRPKIGDILLTKDGTLGRLAVVDRENICVNQSVAVLRPNEKVEPNFLSLLLSSPSYQTRMIEDAGGTTIKHIYITRVDKMEVAYPPAPNDRQAIVEKLDALSEKTKALEAIYERKQSALAELKQSLLQKAFAGEL